MKAGKLDRRVQFTRAAIIEDGYQERLGQYAPLGSPVWASKRDISDSERFQAGGYGENVQTRFQVRWSSFTSGIQKRDRLICEGREYGIVGIKEIGRREGLEITAGSVAE